MPNGLITRASRTARWGGALVALALAACSTLPSKQALSVAGHREAITGAHRIGIAVARFAPAVSIDAEVGGKGGGALYGAGRGALACLEIEKGSTGPGTGLITLICLPFGAAIGAMIGAGHAASSDQIASARSRLGGPLTTIELQEELRQAIERYAAKTGASVQLFPMAEGPVAPGETPRYASVVDYVIEAGVSEIRVFTPGSKDLPYGFAFPVRARLIRAADGVVVDSLSIDVETPTATVDHWLAEDGRMMARAIDAALDEAAEALIDEWLLLYRGSPGPASSATPAPGAASGAELPRVPEFALQPLAPPLRVDMRFFKRPLLPGHLEPVLVPRSPAFVWEAQPRDFQPVGGRSPPSLADLVYDFRVYDAGPFLGQGVAAARLVLEQFGIAQPSFRLEHALQPCSYYFWTVRARFQFEGRTRATEWTGAYRTLAGTVDPSWARRGEWPALPQPWPNRWFYLPFMTGSASGAPCN